MATVTPQAIWQLQCDLLDRLEHLMGPRDANFTICQPRFGDANPHIHVWSDSREAVAYLSSNSEHYWPTAVFELAHESVHLLDPAPGQTNVLEEGIAAHFQFEVTPLIAGEQIPVIVPDYVQAKASVEALQTDVMSLAKLIRERTGTLRKATPAVLQQLCPSTSPQLIARLTTTFSPDGNNAA